MTNSREALANAMFLSGFFMLFVVAIKGIGNKDMIIFYMAAHLFVGSCFQNIVPIWSKEKW